MRRTILVVDNEEEICRLFVESLTAQGFKVAAARTGREALALVEQEPPDLIVLDLVMPGMDGLETLRRIREVAGDVRVVIHTACGTVQQAREAAALGVREFIGKPFEWHRLLELVAREMGDRATAERSA